MNENLLALESISPPGVKKSFLRPSLKRRGQRLIQRIQEKILYGRFFKEGCVFLTQQEMDVNEIGGISEAQMGQVVTGCRPS